MNILFSSLLICASSLNAFIGLTPNNINNNTINENLDTQMRHIYYGDSVNDLTNNSNMPTTGITELKYTFGYDLINDTYDTNNSITYTSATKFATCASDCIYSGVSGMFAFNFNVSYYGNSSIVGDSDNNSYEMELKKMFQLYYGVYHIENDKVIYDCLYYVKPNGLTLTEINFSNSIYLNLKSNYSYNTCLFSATTFSSSATISCDIVSYNYLSDNITQETIDNNNESYNQLLYTNSLSGATCKLALYNLKTGKFDNTYNVIFSNIAEYDTETYTYKLTYGDLYNYVLSNGGTTDNLSSHQLYFDIDFSNNPLNLSEDKYLSLNKGNNTSTLKLLDKSYTQLVNIPSGSYYDTTTQNISYIRAVISYNTAQSNYVIFSDLTFNNYVNTYYQNGYNDAKSVYTNTITSLSNQLNEKTSENNDLNNQINNLTNSITDLQNEINLLKSDTGNYTFSDLFFGIASTPFGVLSSIFNVELMGVNLFSVISAIISLLLIVWLVKKLV